jgi:hypothetical protein
VLYSTSTIQQNVPNLQSAPTNPGAVPPVPFNAATLELPAGNYLVSGNVQFSSDGHNTQLTTACSVGSVQISINSGGIASANSSANADTAGIVVPIQGTISLASAASVSVVCQITNGEIFTPNGQGDGNAVPDSVLSVQFQALQVGSVVQQ